MDRLRDPPERAALFLRHRRDDLLKNCIAPARNDEHPNDSQFAALGGMNEMRLHREAYAVNKVLAWMMEVKLGQPVVSVTYIEPIALRKVELDSVPIIDDRVGPLGPADLEGRLPSRDGAGDIDGGLLVTD